MKATGIVRKVDELGRVVLPMELRKTFDIKIKDAMEIYVDDEAIILKKYEPACIFCGNAQNIVNYSGKNICKECVAKLADSIK
ncbi:MAG: AbrB/MazE/SpoVT family DNA-binding domain-containing protein [Clostridia bacterium]|jgi:transcriptional pleiotropic regulator of transition state genes|nr:AbrB/MazE/SpoVT family DNA-binding domain-containing protein [Clostridiaceae bacterium]